ncbi:MAG TPA: hypothetical protein VL563_14080 [Gemmatimonadales bacterium]|jgi:hypothetical protein|nr:hypothetical protein [Gemmatimonadales bacterium]
MVIGLATVPAILSGQTSLSIYSDGRVVVRRTLPQELKKGRNAITVQIDGLDPATLFSPDTAVTVAGATVRYPSSANDALGRAIGQTIAFVSEGVGRRDTVKATVVRVDPPQYRLADGRLLLAPPGQPLFPSDLVRTTPEATLALDAMRNRPNTQLAYVAQGVTWEATYQAIIASGQASIGGAATVTSQSLRTDSAEIQLVAGSINRTREPKAPQVFEADRVMRAGVAAQVAMPAEQSVGETHVYSLPARLALEPGVPVTTALFPRAAAAVTQEFVVPGALPWRGYFGQQPGEENEVPVQVWYTFKRAKGTSFGDRPLPGGTMQLYQSDSSGRLQLIGEATIGHTPAAKDVRVQSGDAFDVTAERVQTDYNQEMIPPARRGLPSRQRITASYRVTVTNAKTEAVTVDVRENHFGTWKVTESSVPAEKLSSTEMRFRVSVPAGGQTVLTYTLQVES